MRHVGEVVEELIAYGEKSEQAALALRYVDETRVSDGTGAVRSGLYEGAIALTTLGAVSIMNRFHWEMS